MSLKGNGRPERRKNGSGTLDLKGTRSSPRRRQSTIGILSLFAIEREAESLSTLRALRAGRRLGREALNRFLKRRNDLADLLEEAYRWMQADQHHTRM